MKGNSKLYFLFIPLMLIWIVLNISQFFGPWVWLPSAVKVFFVNLNEERDIDQLLFIFNSVLTISGIFLAITSLLISVRNVKPGFFMDFALSKFGVKEFIFLTGLLLISLVIQISLQSLNKALLVYFLALFPFYVFTTVVFVFQIYTLINPKVFLRTLLKESIFKELEQYNFEVSDFTSEAFTIEEDYSVFDAEFNKTSYISTEKKGIIDSFNFEKFSQLLAEYNVVPDDIKIIPQSKIGKFFPDSFKSAHHDFTSHVLFVIRVREIGKKRGIDNAIANNQVYINACINFKNEESKKINEAIKKVDEAIALIKSSTSKLDLRVFDPLKNFLSNKIKEENNINFNESVIVVITYLILSLRKTIQSRELEIKDTFLISLLYRISSINLEEGNRNENLVTQLLDLFYSIIELFIEVKSNLISNGYNVIHRSSELAIPLTISMQDKVLIDSEFLKKSTYSGISYSTHFIYYLLERRLILGKELISKFLEDNLQDLISYLQVPSTRGASWNKEASNFLAFHLCYLGSYLHKLDSSSVENEKLFEKFGISLIEYSYNNASGYDNTTDVLDSFIGNSNFNQISIRSLSGYFEYNFHQSGGYSPQYYNFDLVWLSYFYFKGLDEFNRLQDKTKDYLGEKYSSLIRIDKEKVSSICGIDVRDFPKTLDEFVS